MCVFGQNGYSIDIVAHLASTEKTSWIDEILFLLQLNEINGKDVSKEISCVEKILVRRSTTADRWQHRKLMRAIDGNRKETKRRM